MARERPALGWRREVVVRNPNTWSAGVGDTRQKSAAEDAVLGRAGALARRQFREALEKRGDAEQGAVLVLLERKRFPWDTVFASVLEETRLAGHAKRSAPTAGEGGQ